MINKIKFNDEELLEVFEYLDALRKSGVTNMWGAPAFVERRFSWEDDKASKAFHLWKDTIKVGDLDCRVQKALEIQAHEV